MEQHDFQVVAYMCGSGGCECQRCGKFAPLGVFGFCWPELARFLPFCGRWRCT